MFREQLGDTGVGHIKKRERRTPSMRDRDFSFSNTRIKRSRKDKKRRHSLSLAQIP